MINSFWSYITSTNELDYQSHRAVALQDYATKKNVAPLRKDVNDIYKSVAKTPKVTPGTYEHIKGDTAVFGYLNWSEEPVATHFPVSSMPVLRIWEWEL